MGLRNANIGIGVCIAILAIVFVFFRSASEAALEIVGMVAFLSAFVVYHVLDERERRRTRRR
jgi:hypothetical membrane protein